MTIYTNKTLAINYFPTNSAKYVELTVQKICDITTIHKVSQSITKNSSDLHMDYRRTAVGQKAVSASGATLWN